MNVGVVAESTAKIRIDADLTWSVRTPLKAEFPVMNVCLFEDGGVEFLEPLALTRAAFDLVCGSRSVLARHQAVHGEGQTQAWVRPELADHVRRRHPELAINDLEALKGGDLLYANARWLPSPQVPIDQTKPCVGMIDDHVAYIVGAPSRPSEHLCVDDWLADCRELLPHVEASGRMLNFLWDFVDANPEMLIEDAETFRRSRTLQTTLPPNVSIGGPLENFLVDASATIEPFVMADVRKGPVMIDRGAVVHSFTRLEGPCYIGPDTWILGAKIRGGTTLGPSCRIGGEVEASIVQGWSNKYHEGFLGHSYVGEWVNLAAATQTSDLRNDYGSVRLQVNGHRLSTGRTKIGSYIGDHTKTGLGVLLNTGSVIGTFCNLLPHGALLPQIIPSFCQVQYGTVMERFDLRQMFATAATAMSRRNQTFADEERDFFFGLYDHTAERRRKVIRDAEVRRMRRSNANS
jgi:UDP-N-acetylglucosamine diphosphorylase/glucosamine-1-phosphate N-acetyltransferase